MTAITNHDRATWAAATLRGYCEANEGAYAPYDAAEYIPSDLLADLMHYAAREGIDFARCPGRAAGHYAEEGQEDAALACRASLSLFVIRTKARGLKCLYTRTIRSIPVLNLSCA